MVRLGVIGMTCPTCETSLERALGVLPGVVSVTADHTSGSVELVVDPRLDRVLLRSAVEDAGYNLEVDAAG